MKSAWKQAFFSEASALKKEYPKIGRELCVEDLMKMQIGTPFYVYSPSCGLRLRTKHELDGDNLICYNSTGTMRYKLKNCGKTYVAMEAVLIPLAYQKGRDLFTVVSSNSDEVVSTVQNFADREDAVSSCHISARTCARMCGLPENDSKRLHMDDNGANFIDQTGKHYFWRVVEGVVQ